MSTPTIDELAKKAFGEQDPIAWRQLHETTTAIFFSKLRHRGATTAVAEDLIQEMWVRILPNYDSARPFLPFAMVILNHVLFDWLRAQRQFDRAFEILKTWSRHASPSDNGAETAELAERLDRCVNQLPDEQKEVFRLHVRDELTYESIAQRLGKTEPQIRGMGVRAKSSVLKCLGMR